MPSLHHLKYSMTGMPKTGGMYISMAKKLKTLLLRILKSLGRVMPKIGGIPIISGIR